MTGRYDMARRGLAPARDISAVDSSLQDRVAGALERPSAAGAASWGRPSALNGGNVRDYSVGPWPEHLAGIDPMQQIEEYDEIFRQEKIIRTTGTGGAYIDWARVEQVALRTHPRAGGYQKILLLRFKKMPDTY
jgi:hypothetical protein